MSRGLLIAVIAGAIIVAAIAGIIASISVATVAQDNSTELGTTGQPGKKLTINLNENLGLKESS